MNWVDLAILGMLLVSTLVGLFWGLIRQLFSLLGLVGGIFLAGRTYAIVAPLFYKVDGTGLVQDPNWARILAFVTVLIGYSLAIGALAALLRALVNMLFLGWLDHLLGGVLGFFVSLTLVTTLVVAVTVFPVPNLTATVRASLLAGWLKGYAPVVLALLPGEFGIFRTLAGM